MTETTGKFKQLFHIKNPQTKQNNIWCSKGKLSLAFWGWGDCHNVIFFSRFDGLACRLGVFMHFSSPDDNTRMEARAKSAHKKEEEEERVARQR